MTSCVTPAAECVALAAFVEGKRRELNSAFGRIGRLTNQGLFTQTDYAVLAEAVCGLDAYLADRLEQLAIGNPSGKRKTRNDKAL